MSRGRWAWMGRVTLLTGALGMALGACGPMTFSVTFGLEDRKLSEAVVARDEGAGAAKVLMIDVRGLVSEDPASGLLGINGGPSPVDEVVARLERAAKDSSVKAVVVRINSPGGTVSASDTVYRELRRFREQTGKPIVASLGEIAASGGYYIALASDEIVAEPTSLTASIGVIIPTINVSEGLGRIGIRSRAIKSGPNKDMGDPLGPAREEHYALLQGIVDEFYAKFRARVEERRPLLDARAADEVTDGRVVTGHRAVEVGLADAEGGVREAFEAAKRRAGLERAVLVKYHVEGEKPRTIYAATETGIGGAPSGAGAEINFLQLRLEGLSSLGGAKPVAYYAWLPEL